MKLKAILFGFFCYFFICLNSYAENNALDKLRVRFSDWQKSYSSLTDTEQKKLLEELKDYPLYPYAQYQYFTDHLDTATPEQINQFFSKNSDSPLAAKLMQAYLQKLTKQKNWSTITALNIDNSIASQCRYQYALFQQGKKDKALKPIKNIWLSGNDLPSACDPIFAEWGKTKEKTTDVILQRIELTLKNNNLRVARYLTNQLPDNYKTTKNNLLALLNNPKTLPDFAKNVSPTPFSKTVVNLSFSRFAKADADKAKSLIPTLVKQQKLSSDDEKVMYRAVAHNYFKDSATDEQIKWRETFNGKDHNPSLIEREIRQSLRVNDLEKVAYWINLLPKEESLKDEWQYWKAITLLKNNKQQEANKILNLLIKNRGFYAIYSAQLLKKPYQINLDYAVLPGGKSREKEILALQQKYQNIPVIQRIHELRFWKMQPEALREWRHYLYTDVDNKKYAEIARYAHSVNWGEHSVQATIAGKLWDNWVERLPIVYKETFTESLKKKSISFSYALAIARQESALDATVQSPAGARGLMQLMPGTAKDSAKKIENLNYSSPNQLYDPKVNIELGTYFLNYVYQLFDNNRILSSAAYNAGPNRVKRWLKETDGQLDAIAFIESIPFTETRNYVKSVLAYDYAYAQILGKKSNKILNDNEVNYQY